MKKIITLSIIMIALFIAALGGAMWAVDDKPYPSTQPDLYSNVRQVP